MKKHRLAAIVLFFCALALYVLAFLHLFDETTRIFGIAWVGAGSMFLCLGASCLNKNHSDSDAGSDDESDDNRDG